MNILNNRPPDNYLHSYVGFNASHQVLYNALNRQYKTSPTDYCSHTRRNSAWYRVFTGSKKECHRYVNSKT
jgi:hypothetical protein